MKFYMLSTTLCLVVVLSGCTSGRIRGGKSFYRSFTGAELHQTQSQDPKDASGFIIESQKQIELVIPAKSKIRDGSSEITLASNTPCRITLTEKAQSSNGGAQKNNASSIKAGLTVLRPVCFLGAFVFLTAVASAIWTPLRTLLGGTRGSIILASSGLLLIALPIIIVQHETLVIAVIAIGTLGCVAFQIYRQRTSSTGRPQTTPPETKPRP